MLADQPYSPVTRQQGESASLLETTTFSTFVSRISLICLHSPSVAALASSNNFFSSSVSSSVKDILNLFAQSLGGGLGILEQFLLLVSVLKCQPFLGGTDQFFCRRTP